MGANLELSERQTQVLHLLCSGLYPKEIGTRLDISEKTVEFHRAKLYQNLINGRSSQNELIMVGVRLGFGERKCAYCEGSIPINSKPWVRHCSLKCYRNDWNRNHPRSRRRTYLKWRSDPEKVKRKILYTADWIRRNRDRHNKRRRELALLKKQAALTLADNAA
jgi:hypothetical protein